MNMITSWITFVPTSARIRPEITAGPHIGSERNRSIRPFQVLGEAERRDEAAEDHRLDDDPGNQKVDVVERARVDRAAEDVDEQQHEHDRLDREADQQVGLTRDRFRLRLASTRVSEKAYWSAVILFLLLGRASGQGQETSSRVGVRTAMSSIAMRRRRAAEPPRQSSLGAPRRGH